MIEALFSIVLGYFIAATLFGVLSDNDRQDELMKTILVRLVILSFLLALAFGHSQRMGGTIVSLVMGSVFDETYLFLLGVVLALIWQVVAEGWLHTLWVNFHPQSAPTRDVGAGQRARVAGFAKKAVPATLVGTSTAYLTSELDLRTQTLVQLCFYAFDDMRANNVSRIESYLRLGTGHRQRAYHKLVAGLRGRPNLRRTVHPYWRSVNGSSRMGVNLFGDLCDLAYNTGNLGGGTVVRLRKVGETLQLTPAQMSQSLSRLR